MKVKICLVGDEAVGKTSLVRRFVLDQFDDRYIITLGAKVSKRNLTVRHGAEAEAAPPAALASDLAAEVDLDITIWDIMGSKGFRELLREAYFHGAQGMVAVCDVTKPQSLQEIRVWIENVFEVVGRVPVVVAVNKCDIRDRHTFDEAAIRREAEALGAPWFYTSAKTGQGVEDVFKTLAAMVVRDSTSKAIPA